MPKVWTKEEVTQIIYNEVNETINDIRTRFKRYPTVKEFADLVYCALDEHNLIQFEP